MGAIEVLYEGELSTRAVLRSGVELKTDAPKESGGKGEGFSPTDLIAVALGSCVLTLMEIAARKLNVDIQGTRLTVAKEMQTAPFRRIGRLVVYVHCPRAFASEIAEKLVKAAETCPVKQSLHPDVHQELIFHWGDA